MKINVTADNIKAGARGPTTCPVALAMYDAGLPNCLVGCTIFYADKFDYESQELPNEVVTFIRAFDRGDAIEPFTFEVSV